MVEWSSDLTLKLEVEGSNPGLSINPLLTVLYVRMMVSVSGPLEATEHKATHVTVPCASGLHTFKTPRRRKVLCRLEFTSPRPLIDRCVNS